MNAAGELLGEKALARHGAKTALLCGDESVSFAELAARARRGAGAVRSFGVRPGDRVLFLMRDTPECAAAWLGVVQSGAVAVAMNSRLGEADYRHILADSAARLAIVEDVFVEARPDLTAELAREGRIAVAGRTPAGLPSWTERARGAAPLDPHPGGIDAPALWLYSSGTTGRPKGVIHAHRAIAACGGSFRRFGIGEGDRVFATSKFFFSYGLEHALLAPLALGASSILCPDWPEPEAVFALAARHRPTAVFSVPTLYRRLLAEPAERLAALRGVRHFVAAGERLSPSLFQQWRAALGAEILSLYGMSETFCACMVTPAGSADGLRTGLPLDEVEVRLLDAAGAPATAGEPGVLWVRHPALAIGYANLPAQTTEYFRDGWFCSRDLFVRDAAGFYLHQGRSDELLKIAGQWVQPGELEEIAAAASGVAEAACVPVPDGDGLERLALFVTARGGAEEALSAALAACEARLPRHKRPKWLRAVDELPRTATGKVQRYKLREWLQRELAGKD